MLNHSFFSIEKVSREETIALSDPQAPEKFIVEVMIHPGHPVFEGHFPGNPVIPGVCQVQMVTEILEEIYRKKFRLTEADNIKFLSMINPIETNKLSIALSCRHSDEENIIVNATASAGDKSYLKLKAQFRPDSFI
ncbi:MAG: 3-hydroxyacyl-ACP dehydratase [bacterium]